MSHDEHVNCDVKIAKLRAQNKKLKEALRKIQAQHLIVWTIANNALN